MMNRYRQDQGLSEREIQVSAIKKVLPDFNDEGKSDAYIQSFFEAMVENQNEALEDPETTEGEEELYEDSANQIQQYKNARLNMKGE